MIYDFLIKDKAGKTLAILDSAKNRGYEIWLNKPGSASFDVSPLDPKITGDILLTGDKELFIYRYNTLIWGGELKTRRTQIDADGENVSLTAKGFLQLLEHKIIGSPSSPITYSSQDLSTIAWGLINAAQTGSNASFGITQGSLATSRNADRTYDDFQVLKDAIEGLSNLNVENGIDIEIGPDKKFSTFYPQKGTLRDEVVFEYGVNIMSFTESNDATNMANEVIVLGEGMGVDMITATRDSSDPTIQSTYKIRQKTISRKTVKETATLNDHGDQELARNQVQSQIVSVMVKGKSDPQIGSYNVGDTVRVKIKYGYLEIDQFLRIYGIRVTISDNDDETIEIFFSPQ